MKALSANHMNCILYFQSQGEAVKSYVYSISQGTALRLHESLSCSRVRLPPSDCPPEASQRLSAQNTRWLVSESTRTSPRDRREP